MRRLRAVQPSTQRQSATASARVAKTGAASTRSSAPAAIAWVSRSGAFSGATSTSFDRPMVFIARAAEPMLPGCWVPTRTMRSCDAAGCAGAGGSPAAELDGSLMWQW